MMKRLKGYLKIPVEMCFYALKNRIVRPFQLYIYLKIVCNGKMKISKKDKKDIAYALGLKSDRSISNNLKILSDLGWISYSKKSGYYFIKGFEVIRMLLGLKRITSVEFSISEIKHFRAFLGATVIREGDLVFQGFSVAYRLFSWKGDSIDSGFYSENICLRPVHSFWSHAAQRQGRGWHHTS